MPRKTASRPGEPRARRGARFLRPAALLVAALAATAEARDDRPRAEGPAPPARIVALAPSCAEILFDLGAGERVVGVSDFAADLPGAAGKTRVGGFAPDLERLVALKPDLVVASRDGTDLSSFRRIQDLGFATVVTDGASIDGVFADVTRVGAAIGARDRAGRLVAALSARVAAVARRVAARAGPRARVVVLVWPDPPIVAGRATFVGDVLERAGATNAAPPEAGAWPRVSVETLAAWRPDLVVRPETAENGDAFARALAKDGPLRLVNAVREGRVVRLPGALLERPGPRLVDALERLAAALETRADPRP